MSKPLTFVDVLELMKDRFRSSNSIPVERATIKAHEFELLMDQWSFMLDEIERLRFREIIGGVNEQSSSGI